MPSGTSTTTSAPSTGVSDASSGAMDPLADALRGRALSDSLGASEVSTSAPADVPLRRDELPALDQRLSSVADPSKRPIQDALRAGTAAVGPNSVTLPTTPTAPTASGIVDRAAEEGARETMVETAGSEYTVSAKLNPWIRIARGRITEVGGSNPRQRGLAAADGWEFVRLADHPGLTGADMVVGSAWPRLPAPPPAAVAMDVDAPEHETPVRDAYTAARVAIEARIRRALTVAEWQAIADFDEASIRGAVDNAGRRGNPLEYLAGGANASCIPTSLRMFTLLGAGDPVALGDGGSVAARVNAVAAQIELDGAVGLFRMQFGDNDHGFVVLVRNGGAELIQSFAGAHGETLADNLASDRYSFAAAELATALRDLTVAGRTAAAQNTLFDGRIDDNGASPITAMTFRSEQRALPGDLDAQVAERLDRRARALNLRR